MTGTLTLSLGLATYLQTNMPADRSLRQRLKKKIRDKFHSDHSTVDSGKETRGGTPVSPPKALGNGSPASVEPFTLASSASASNTQSNTKAEPCSDLGEHAFQVAVRKWQDGLKEEERKAFLDAISGQSKEEIVADIIQLDQRHEKTSKSRRNAGTIHKVVQILDPSIQVISLALSADPAASQVSSIILGGFKLILKMAKGWEEFFSRLTGLLDRLSKHTDRWTMYAKARLRDDERLLILDSLIDVYGDLLRICQEGRRVFLSLDDQKEREKEKNAVSWRVLIHQIWKPFEETFGGIEQELASHVDQLQDAAEAVNLRVTTEIRDKLDQSLEQAEQGKIKQERAAFMNWISSLDFETAHKLLYERRLDGTGDWIFGSREYQRWKDHHGSSLLWCYGNAGTGKSVLVSNVIDKLSQKYELLDNFGIAFAYCKYDDKSTQPLIAILPAIIKQLCYKKAILPDRIIQLFRDYSGQAKPRTEDLFKDMFQSITEEYDTVYIVIDALDECPRKTKDTLGQRGRIIDFIVDSVRSNPRVKFLVASREEKDIRFAFQEFDRTVELEAKYVQADIKKYVKSVVNKEPDLRKLGKSMKEKIIKTLTTTNNAMFLWVHLQLEALTSQSLEIDDIDEFLKDIPSDIDDTYDRSLSHIHSLSEGERNLAYKCLAWVLYTARQLRADELRYLVALPDDEARWSLKVEPKSIEAILSVCSHLLIKDGDMIRMVHYSAKEYIFETKRHTTPRDWVEKLQQKEQALDYIASCSLSYALWPELEEPCDTLQDLIVRVEENRALWHAAKYFDLYVFKATRQLCDHSSHLLERLLQQDTAHLRALVQLRFVRDHFDLDILAADFHPPDIPINMAALVFATHLHGTQEVDQHRRRLFEKGIPPRTMHLAATEGLLDSVNEILKAKHDPNERDGKGATPLYYAAKHGHLDVCQTLLRAGASPDSQLNDENYSDFPLHIASEEGQYHIVDLLLRKGAKASIIDDGGNQYLQSEVLRFELNVLISDLGSGGRYHTAMIAACVKGAEQIANRLLFANADFRVRSDAYGSALYASCASGCIDFVQQLLDRGVDVNEPCGPSNSYAYPLIVACINGHDRIVELLVRRGADLNVTTAHGDYRHALPAACHSCGTATILNLLEHDCGRKGRSSYYDRALYEACGNESPRLQLIQLLLGAYKANPNVRHKETEHGFPLIAACSNGDLSAVRLLLEYADNKADVNVHFGYDTPLTAACAARSPEIAELLIQHGADVNRKFGKYNYPLLTSVFGGDSRRNGDQGTACVLLRNKADVLLAGRNSLRRFRRNEEGGLADIARLGDKGTAPNKGRLMRTGTRRNDEADIDPVLSELVQYNRDILELGIGPEKHLKRIVDGRKMPRVRKILDEIIPVDEPTGADAYRLDNFFSHG